MPISIDGINLIITLPAATPIVDAEMDLYSEWKKWALLADNLGVEQAFRTVGGDPLTSGIEAGAYFFLQNDLGWRIRPAEEDATVLLTGNLAPEDSTLPMTVPTIGGFTVLINGLQPITQSVEALLALEKEVLYNGAIHINSVSGLDTNEGTPASPVQTSTAARVIADSLGIRKYSFVGSITLGIAHDRWSFTGESASFNDVLNLNNQSVDESRAQGCRISGDATESNFEALFCEIDNPGNLHGVFRQCGLLNNFKVEATTPQTYVFHHCYSQVAGSGRPVLDFTSLAVTHNVQFRNYVGGLNVRNMVQGNLSIDTPGATVDLEATVTGGDIVVRGTGILIDNSGVLVTKTEGFIDGLDFRLMKQIATGKVVISVDDLTATVYDEDLVTVLAVLNRTADGRTRTP